MLKTWAVEQDMSLLKMSFGGLDLNTGWWVDPEDLINLTPHGFTLNLSALSKSSEELSELVDTEDTLVVILQGDVIINEEYRLVGRSFVFTGKPMPIKFHFHRIGDI